jgi:two-component system sensor histidine kinase RpfC
MNDDVTKIAWLKQRIALTGDTEPEQIFLRLFIGIFLILYFCLPCAKGETFSHAVTTVPSQITLGYYFGAMAIAAALLIYPKQSPVRRSAGIVLDMVSLSIVMYLTGSDSIFLFVLYLWVVLGNGFRYGLNYLYISQLVAVLGFSAAITWGEYWQADYTRSISISLLILLVLVPAYSAFLIKKLHKAIDDSKQANEAKTKFLASMSHELRTPLNGVIGLGDLLRETKLDKEQHDLVKTMHQSAHTLLGLIEKVLDISKIEAGKLIIVHEPLDLHALVNSVISIQSSVGAARGLTVVCTMDSNVPFLLKGDGQHIKQVLVNLIGNAIKFTDVGSVKLHVKTMQQNNDQVLIRFEVKDTGMGIASELLSKVFDDFTQVSGKAQSTVSGTGLGTTISKELVELMGGKIGVESELNKGSLFWFELPFTKIAHDSLDLSGNHLLLISTDETAKTVIPLLDGWKVAFDVAPSPTHALAMLQNALEKNMPYKDVLLESAALPNMSPILFAQTVQLRGLLDELSLILIDPDKQLLNLQEIDQYFVSTLADLTNKSQLFNAIHAAQSIHVNSHNVVSIADYYHNQLGAKALNILVAEDNRVNQQVIEGILKKAGHTVTLAEDGEQALDMLTADLDKIDLLIVDKNMPKRSGDEVVQALRFFDTAKELPVIMLTADATPEAKESSISLGVNLFLTKPIDSRDLLEKIAALSRHLESEAVDLSELKSTNDISILLNSSISTEGLTVEEHLAENIWYDENMFNELLILDRDPSFIRRLVNGFMADGEKHISRINDAVSDDYLQLRESLHALKGSASELGANRLVELCRQGEEYKPYDIGSEQLVLLSNSLDSVYRHTASALNAAASDASNH